MVREGKPKGFFYLDHRTVDGRLGIITDTYATPANVHDSIVYLGGSTASGNASASTPPDWMPAMPLSHRPGPGTAPHLASPAIAGRHRRVPA